MSPETPAPPGEPISGCIVAMNEEDRIEACIRSIDFCDEIVVVDSHSTDRTREIATQLGARVIERDWPGYVGQKQFAAKEAKHDWLFFIDADERASETLRREIIALKAKGIDRYVGWRMPRLTCYVGRWIHHGVWYPNLQLRLFDRRHGGIAGNDPHDKTVVDGPAGRLKGDLYHYSFRDFQGHLDTIDNFTRIMAEGLDQRGRRARVSDVILRPAVRFFRSYVLKLGFLDGWRGLVIAYLAAHYVRMKYTRLLIMQRGEPDPQPPDPAT